MVSSYSQILLERLKVTRNASEVRARLTAWSRTSVSRYNTKTIGPDSGPDPEPCRDEKTDAAADLHRDKKNIVVRNL